MHAVAFVDAQVSMLLPPDVTAPGLADSDNVGAAAPPATVSVAVVVADARVLVQVIEYALVTLAVTTALPEMAFAPDHAPVAAQETAFVDAQ